MSYLNDQQSTTLIKKTHHCMSLIANNAIIWLLAVSFAKIPQLFKKAYPIDIY